MSKAIATRKADDFWQVTFPVRPTFVPLENCAKPFNVPHRRWFKGTGVRDTQRRKAYRAEDKALPKMEQQRFKDIAGVARYCRDLMSTVWFQRRFPEFVKLNLYYRPKKRAASANSFDYERSIGGSCFFGAWALGDRPGRRDPERLGGEWLVLHELAHAIAQRGHKHDALWARIYLELVGFKMGREAYESLREQFRQHKVRYKPTRRMDPAQRRAAAERLRQVRAAKETHP